MKVDLQGGGELPLPVLHEGDLGAPQAPLLPGGLGPRLGVVLLEGGGGGHHQVVGVLLMLVLAVGVVLVLELEKVQGRSPNQKHILKMFPMFSQIAKLQFKCSKHFFKKEV